MSHSRIIQVSKNIVNKNDRMRSSNFDMDVILRVVDGVDYITDPDTSREEELKWLKVQLDKIGFTLDGEKITVGKDNFFIDEWKDKAVEIAEEFDLCKMK